MEYCTDSGVNKVTDIPYFEGDFWASTIEDLIRKFEEPIKVRQAKVDRFSYL